MVEKGINVFDALTIPVDNIKYSNDLASKIHSLFKLNCDSQLYGIISHGTSYRNSYLVRVKDSGSTGKNRRMEKLFENSANTLE